MKEIQLTQGQVALVSDEDFQRLSQGRWQAEKHDKAWYAVRTEGTWPRQRKVYMHRVVVDAPVGMEVDHKDRNGLNNQRENLRICTGTKNRHNTSKHARNTSGYKGVSWNKRKGKWDARLMNERKLVFLGYFEDVIEAAKAYDKAAIELFGEFANPNFPIQS